MALPVTVPTRSYTEGFSSTPTLSFSSPIKDVQLLMTSVLLTAAFVFLTARLPPTFASTRGYRHAERTREIKVTARLDFFPPLHHRNRNQYKITLLLFSVLAVSVLLFAAGMLYVLKRHSDDFDLVLDLTSDTVHIFATSAVYASRVLWYRASKSRTLGLVGACRTRLFRSVKTIWRHTTGTIQFSIIQPRSILQLTLSSIMNIESFATRLSLTTTFTIVNVPLLSILTATRLITAAGNISAPVILSVPILIMFYAIFQYINCYHKYFQIKSAHLTALSRLLQHAEAKLHQDHEALNRRLNERERNIQEKESEIRRSEQRSTRLEAEILEKRVILEYQEADMKKREKSIEKRERELERREAELEHLERRRARPPLLSSKFANVDQGEIDESMYAKEWATSHLKAEGFTRFVVMNSPRL